MGSIPLDILMGDEALTELVLALDGKTKADGLRVSSTYVANVRDIVRHWLHRREKEYYARPVPNFAKFENDPAAFAATIGHTVQLEKLRIFSIAELSKEIMIDDVDYAMDSMHRSMIGRYNAYVWAESESVQHKEVKYPADWWQAFKLRFMESWPKWLQRKVAPVEYHREVMDVKAVYPTFRQKMDDRFPSRLIVAKRDEWYRVS